MRFILGYTEGNIMELLSLRTYNIINKSAFKKWRYTEEQFILENYFGYFSDRGCICELYNKIKANTNSIKTIFHHISNKIYTN